MTTKLGYRGYCTHQPFNGLRIPVPVQNILLRDFATKRNLMFKLSVNELNFPDCHVQLETVLNELSDLEGVLMASFFMLPPSVAARRSFYERLLDEGAIAYFVIENVRLANAGDIQQLEEMFQLNNSLSIAPKTIPQDLLPNLQGIERFSGP